MNDETCKIFLCKESIHSARDWKLKALAKKKELQNAGVGDYEVHPEYRKITDCKPDDDDPYPSISDCAQQPNEEQDEGEDIFDAFYKSNYPKNYKGYQKFKKDRNNGAQTGPSPSKRKKCSKGERRNKSTGNCESKTNTKINKSASPVRQTTAKTKKRCPNGTRSNKRTGNCEPTKSKNRRSATPDRQAPSSRPANTTKRERCPNGSRFNKRTKNCQPK